MCLKISSHTGINIAKKDIVCCKMIGAEETRLIFWKYWIAPFMETKHKYNQVLKACDHLRPSIQWTKNCSLVIHKGFHAVRSLEYLEDEYDNLKYAIIPKGAEYCIGKDDDIVANKMIVFSSKKKYEKYLKR